MVDKLHHILQRFPKNSESIRLLIAENPEFHALCKDYDDCVHACQFWGQSTASEAETRVKEYRTLVEELEKEIDAVLRAL